MINQIRKTIYDRTNHFTEVADQITVQRVRCSQISSQIRDVVEKVDDLQVSKVRII